MLNSTKPNKLMSGRGDSDGFAFTPAFSSSNSNDECAGFTVRTRLASPNVDVLATLTVGDLLNLYLSGSQGPIRAMTTNNETAGTVICVGQQRLIACMNNGVDYNAEIITINGAECQIRIRGKQ